MHTLCPSPARDVRQQLRSLPGGQGLAALARVEREMLLKVCDRGHYHVAGTAIQPLAEVPLATQPLCAEIFIYILCVGDH
jgi:hypothetical protein